jgi:hypothetical protein
MLIDEAPLSYEMTLAADHFERPEALDAVRQMFCGESAAACIQGWLCSE